VAERAPVVCASAEIADGGPGVRFVIDETGRPQAAFAIRYRGVACAYVNRCPHAGTELDWEPGAFFDLTGHLLVCATHGALFDPLTGACVAGPCRGACLERIELREQDGRVLVAGDRNPARA
jgi:nitrite reductase/ring-hydroxylating ferredoxin subunit